MIAEVTAQPNTPVYLSVDKEHSDYPHILHACDTHETLVACTSRTEARKCASEHKWPIVAHSRHAASRRAMYLVDLMLKHAVGTAWCTPRLVGGRSGSPHARELQALSRTGLVRRQRRFCDIARDGSWRYALTPAGDAAAKALFERSAKLGGVGKLLNREERPARMLTPNDVPDLPRELTPELIADLIARGMLPKSKLEVGGVYLGKCRNATVAKWEGERFIHWRVKFSSVFEEHINHPEDDDGFDVFVPIRRLLDSEYRKPTV